MARHFLAPMLLAATLLAGCSGLGDTSIANGGIVLDHGEITLHASDAPAATIDAAGTLRIDGKAVALAPDQRALLLRYYQGVRAVREHGIATGKAGAAAAAASLKDAVAGGSAAGDKAADRADQVTRMATRICQDLAEVKAAQDALAVQLPAFKPYANILDEDKDCHDDGKAAP
jgi:hypothetical protein